MSFDLIRKTLPITGEHLGDMLWWSLADARTDRLTLESLWARANLPMELLPESPMAEKAIKTAVREAQVGHHDRLVRLGKEDNSEILYAVVREDRQNDGSLNYYTEARMTLHRRREVFSSDWPSHDIVSAVESRFRLYRTTHTADDVRRTVVRTLHSFAAVTLRDVGGVYWVPAPYADHVRRLQAAIEQIGTSRVYLLPINRSPEAERTLGEVAWGSLEEELAALQAEIEAFLAAPPERASTLTRRLDAYQALQAKARLYSTLLKTEVHDLDAKLNKLSGSVEHLLNQKAAA